MKIEIKNLKHSAFASQETHCFAASLYVDGKKIGEVGNDGHGGADYFHGDQAAYRVADKWCRENLPKWGSEFSPEKGDTMETDIEIVVGNLVNDALVLKEMKRLMKGKIVMVDGGQLLTAKIRAPLKIDAAMIAKAREMYPSATILNGMDEAEALALFRKHG